MENRRKSLRELGLCDHMVTLDEKEIELAVRLGLNFNTMWDEIYEEENRSDRSRLEVEIATEAAIQVELEVTMRMLILAKNNPQERSRYIDDLYGLFNLPEDRKKDILKLIEDDSFFDGYSTESGVLHHAAQLRAEERRQHKRFLYEIAAKHMVAVESRGDLERRHNDSEDFIEVPVWGLEAALEEAYKAGKKSWTE